MAPTRDGSDQERDDRGRWAPTGENAADRLKTWFGKLVGRQQSAASEVRADQAGLPSQSPSGPGDPRFVDLPLAQIPSPAASSRAAGDAGLEQIWDARGFNGPPTVVSPEEFDRLAASGAGTVVYRGIAAGTREESEAWAEQYRSADTPHAGLGFLGSGTYTSVEAKEAQRYAGENGAQMRMIVPDDLNVVSTMDLRMERMAWSREWQSRVDAAPELEATRRMERLALSDDGRFAAALGYQAIRRESTNGTVYNIQDRSAVIVEAAQ